MSYTRRTFLTTSAAVATTAASASLLTPRPLLAYIGSRPEPVPPIQDPRLKTLVQRALDAAHDAGATYADVRLTHSIYRTIGGVPATMISDGENMSVGVRALVHGYWGFAASAIWSDDEMVRLGRAAVAQAKSNDFTRTRVVDLAPVPVVQDGHWETPVRIDPFSIYPVELLDYVQSLNLYVGRFPDALVNFNDCMLQTQRKAFGSSEGSYYTQQRFLTQGILQIQVVNGRTHEAITRNLDTLSIAGVGLELYQEQPIRDNIRRLVEEIRTDLALPFKPVDPNRYPVLLDAESVGQLVSATIGAATQLDRALGYEANSSGTSYLNDPAAMLGTYQVGSSLLSVTGNRNEVGGAATVQWDDDGVHPESFPLITNGVVQGFQTVRESAGWLRAPNLGTSQAAAFRSTGCAYARDATDVPLTHTPNLVMQPGTTSADFHDLLRSVERGVVMRNLTVDMDFQQLNGFAMGDAYEVLKGKRTARLDNAGILFRTPEFWKSLTALGGSASARRFGRHVGKGEPRQDSYHSVTAVPALFKDQTIIDVLRKA